MPTFDVVNKLDMQAIDNAINDANRTIATRYDFKGVEVLLELDKKAKTLKVEVPDEMKLDAVKDIVNTALIRQKVSMKVIKWGEKEQASLGAIRLKCTLVEGIDKENAKIVTQKIKDSGLKVKSSIQGDAVRVDGKQIDDLQAVIAMLKEANLPIPLQFDNMKR